MVLLFERLMDHLTLRKARMLFQENPLMHTGKHVSYSCRKYIDSLKSTYVYQLGGMMVYESPIPSLI